MSCLLMATLITTTLPSSLRGRDDFFDRPLQRHSRLRGQDVGDRQMLITLVASFLARAMRPIWSSLMCRSSSQSPSGLATRGGPGLSGPGRHSSWFFKSQGTIWPSIGLRTSRSATWALTIAAWSCRLLSFCFGLFQLAHQPRPLVGFQEWPAGGQFVLDVVNVLAFGDHLAVDVGLPRSRSGCGVSAGVGLS